MILRPLAAAALLALSAGSAPAATLFDAPSALVYSGEAEFAFDFGAGLADAFGQVTNGSATFAFDVFGSFDPNTFGQGAAADLFIDFGDELDGTLSAFEVDLDGGRLAALLDLVDGAGLGAFRGAEALAIFTSLDGSGVFVGAASVEVRRLAPVQPIPLPAAASLLIGALGALAMAGLRAGRPVLQPQAWRRD